MLWTVAVILFVLWALGMGTSYTGGGLVHVLLVVAAVVIVFQFMGAAGPSDGPRTCTVNAAGRRRRSVERSRRQDNDESPVK